MLSSLLSVFPRPATFARTDLRFPLAIDSSLPAMRAFAAS